MTYEELNTIEQKLRKVDQFAPGGYGVVTALELVEELRKYIPPTSTESPVSGDYKVGQLPVELL